MKNFDEWWAEHPDRGHLDRLYQKYGLDIEQIVKECVTEAWRVGRMGAYKMVGGDDYTCPCGGIYTAADNLTACVVIYETGYCPNCIAAEIKEPKEYK